MSCSLPCGCGNCESIAPINLRVDRDSREYKLKFDNESDLRLWLVENNYNPHTQTPTGRLYFRESDWSVAIRMFDEDGKVI